MSFEDYAKTYIVAALEQTSHDVAQDVYVVSLFVYDEEDDPRYPTVTVGSIRISGATTGSAPDAPISWVVRRIAHSVDGCASAQPWQRARSGERPVQVTGSVKAAPGMTLMTWGRSSSAAIHDRAAGPASKVGPAASFA